MGIPAVLLFGIPMHKDPEGTEAYDSQGIVQEAIRVIKQATPDLLVITDVCLCEYTDHGHCGLIVDERVDNDSTLEILARVAPVPRGGRRGRSGAVCYDGRAGGGNKTRP